MAAGTFVLMGSGEFLPWALAPDQWALDQAAVDSDRVLVLPTASAPEGDAVFDRWASMGMEHFERLGARPEVVGLRNRSEAESAEVARRFRGARYIFFSGGNPAYLVRVLAGTPAWDAVLEAVGAGAALGGCSAGMMAFGLCAPDTAGTRARRPLTADTVRANWSPALRLFPDAYFQAHWDALDGYYPGLRSVLIEAQPDGSVLFALDENTAAFGDGKTWNVVGSGALTIDQGRRIPAGATIELALGSQLPAKVNPIRGHSSGRTRRSH